MSERVWSSSVDRLMATDLARDVEFLNARTRVIGTVITNRHLGDHGLRVRSYSVLSLACSGLRPTQRELAEFLRLDPSQIVSIVDDLESSGLVVRETDSTDRRSKVIVGTSHGARLHREASRAAARAEDEALAGLTTDERDTLRELLHRAAFASAGESAR